MFSISRRAKSLHEDGFSILEVLVSVAIMGIAFATAYPALRETRAGIARGKALSQLEFDLRRLRTESVSNGVIGVFEIADDGKSYRGGFDYLPYQAPPAIETVGFSSTFDEPITVGLSDQIFFDSRGFLVDEANDPESIVVSLMSDGSVYGRIFISPTGALDFQSEP